MTYLQHKLNISDKEAAAILLARAASPSPSSVNAEVIKIVLNHINPAGIVEIIVWLSVLQLLHRLGGYYAIVDSTRVVGALN
jgi:hypothetical protein